MMIVPENDLLVVEARIDPTRSTASIEAGGGAPLLDLGGRTTPEYIGTVETISPDLVVDQRGSALRGAGLSAPQALADLGAKMVRACRSGFIGTARTVLSYLVKPLGDQIMHTFRER